MFFTLVEKGSDSKKIEDVIRKQGSNCPPDLFFALVAKAADTNV
jgi:hypothetical protein